MLVIIILDIHKNVIKNLVFFNLFLKSLAVHTSLYQ